MVAKGVSLLQQIKDAQPKWFSPENKRFFNDVAYKGLYGKKSHRPFLVRSTYAWTDMLSQPKRLHWRINTVNPDTLDIEGLLDEEFRTLEDVRKWLNEN